MSTERETFRFRSFELDIAAYELRRNGRSIRLERQPMDVLILLVERRGQLVSRGDIIDRLWGRDVFVDVETGVHTAVRKIRQALRDSRQEPKFVETVSGKGYRFIADVEVIAAVSGMTADVQLGGGAAATRVTLAVLPFENRGSDREREYLAAALTDETSASLAQIDPGRLIVKGRTLGYKGTTKTAAEIGRELSVEYLVESSICAESDRLRITVKLIRVSDQEYVWSESYERRPTSVLGFQQELSRAIAQQIRLRLAPDRLSGLGRRQTGNAEAYDAYLRGRYLTGRRTPETNRRAIQHYEHAIALDPDYALAWAALSHTYAASAMNSDARPLDVGPHARDAAAQAVRANPDLAETQWSVGYVKWLLDWDWNVAEIGLRRAIELDPSSGVAYRTLGHALSQLHRHSEAESAMRRVRELEPLEPMSYALSAQVAFQARDYNSAVELAQRTILIEPNLWIGYMALGQTYEQQGMNDLAMEALSDATRLSGGNSKAMSLTGYLLAKIGRASEAREVLKTLDAISRERYVPPYAMALVHAGLGDRHEVFEWLDKAYDARDVHLIFLPVDPKWDGYRADSRFEALLTRCRFTTDR
jgi:DNA-binding winged helix-turn-helix (wHTH) protein/tetratricopeptide (TPR) repeat protein